MIKINALNEESEEESGSEEEATREALEQIAQQQYYKALELKHKGCTDDATRLLSALLDTELLDDVKKPAPGEKSTSHLLDLKYLCYKNLGAMLSEAGDLESSINAYIAAAELDDTDITLWHRLGHVCMRAQRYELALHAFRCGVQRNPGHMPCLDKIITLLLGLDKDKEELIATIYETLKLDPGYLRALAYRKYIYTNYLHVRDYMQFLNPIYKWDEHGDATINEDKAALLLKEADDIHKAYLEQQAQNQVKYVIPTLKLKKTITQYSWELVAESLVHMHTYMTDNCFSHACPIEIIFEKKDIDESMVVCEENKEIIRETTTLNETEDNISHVDKSIANTTENNDGVEKDKILDSEKQDSDAEPVAESTLERDRKRRNPVRRRGCALSFLEQWEWCKRSNGNKRRSNRKKEKRQDDNIYDTLRRIVPQYLAPDTVVNGEQESNTTEVAIVTIENCEELNEENPLEYFNTESEVQDVKQFITKYTEQKHDIIDILKEFLFILAEKYNIKWPKRLTKLYSEANECYSKHISIPSDFKDCDEDILHYCMVNLISQEFIVNEKLSCNEADTHDFSVVQAIGNSINFKPNAFASANPLEVMLRYLWLKLHINILNKTGEEGLDCLYQLANEFEAMDEHGEYRLAVGNFTFKPIINEAQVSEYITFMERNEKLSTVMDLHNRNCHEEVLSIVVDSFEHCKAMAGQQEDDMSLDFATQLMLILDTLWGLGKVDECFKWALTCLHEALKHYFRHTSGSPKYEKWTRTVVKILTSMEHILRTEGLVCLEVITHKELSQGLEDLIRIIGHQVETNSSEMPIDTVAPWIIMHYIIQREEDQGRGRTPVDPENSEEDVPNPLMILFIAHEQLGSRGWCCKSEATLLYFILDTVTPRLRSPLLVKALELIDQHMEQVVYCLYGHPAKKYKLKHLVDHNIAPHTLDWKRAQQIYEIYRPPVLPALEGKVSSITQNTNLLFKRILELLPPEYDPKPYIPELEKYIKGTADKFPQVKTPMPFKIKDIYFLLGDYYFKKDDHKLAIEYNMLDVLVNNERLESWAEISLSKSCHLETLLNSCQNLNNEREFLTPAKSVIRCYKRTIQLDPTHRTILIEYGIFVYYVHSFCSRLLKQASESLSMEDFDSLEKQKEEMLDTTQKCFMTVVNDMDISSETDKSNEDAWLNFYMLGKVAEKRNKPPSTYLDYYMQAVKSLQEANATYPLKISYNTPTYLCREVLELHYRIHASILKYIEQHENKPIPKSVGVVFQKCIDDWNKSPFSKRPRKEDTAETETENKTNEPVHAANILKRSISDVGEEGNSEAKKQKIENAAAKVKTSVSLDMERSNKPSQINSENLIAKSVKDEIGTDETELNNLCAIEIKDSGVSDIKKNDNYESTSKPQTVKPDDNNKNERKESSSNSSSSSASESSSSESSSDSGSSKDSAAPRVRDSPLPDDEIMKIVSACIDALEDCASRFPPHYKAIYRLAHYHFYYKKGKDIERCRDLMLSTFTLRVGQKLGGLFSERKQNNFFNNIWKINITEVDRAGSFAFHMSRSVLLTMEILKEIDDHKTLLDLSLHLQRIPDQEKKYLRDSDREELAQQAFSLCVQSLKGQLLKFSQQADLKSNDVERQALKSLMLDIYRAYQRAQKQTNPKQFTNLLVEAYKLVTSTPHSESTNLVDVSIKYCQWLVSNLKQQATQASIDKSQNAQKKQSAKLAAEIAKSVATTSAAAAPSPSAKPDLKVPPQAQLAPIPLIPTMPGLQDFSKMTPTEINGLQNYINAMRAALTTSYQAEFCRQFFSQDSLFFNYPPQPPKKKRGPKPKIDSTLHKSKSVPNSSGPAASKSVSTLASRQKSSSGSMAPSMGTVLSSLPASMTANLTYNAPPAPSAPNHNPPPPPHSQPSPGKTLQEKLAERQKILPSMSKSSKDLNASMMKLPSSLTITKTASSRKSVIQGKKQDMPPPPPSSSKASDVIIVLDDDDD